VAPVLAAAAAAIAFAALATPRTRIGELRPAVGALLGWALVAVVGPTAAGDPVAPLGDGPAALTLVAVAVAASLTTLLALRYRERRADRAAGPLVAPGSPVGERIT
jgi:Zn-dependent protease with chaperone function